MTDRYERWVSTYSQKTVSDRNRERAREWLHRVFGPDRPEFEVDSLTALLDEARQQLTCIDLWLRRRQPVTHESATLRSVQEFVLAAEAEVERLRADRDSVLALHTQHPERVHGAYCRSCHATWPCPTVRIFDGEEG